MRQYWSLIFLVCLGPAQAQKLASTGESGANLPARPIGINDLLSVNVYGAPELSRTARVDAEGRMRLPMLKDKIEARGAMPAELEMRLASALTRERILVDPVVIVTIAEYGGKPVSVAGAVRHPLTFDIHGPTTLLDALARAEGLAADAGSEILVTSSTSSGNVPGLLQRVSIRELMERGNPEANLMLLGGEEVRVPEIGRVFVVGSVKKSGAFRYDDRGAMTVLQALAVSEGLAPFSAKEAFIYRPEGGTKKEIPVALRKIMDRKAPDVALEANDIFYVPDNRRGRITATALERAVSFAVGTASGALILSVNH